jgi:quercetin dioxygenase-like cupin family protein
MVALRAVSGAPPPSTFDSARPSVRAPDRVLRRLLGMSVGIGIVGALGCSTTASSPPMAAAAGVSRADGGMGAREPRVVPLKSMAGDVEILYGDPERDGEPFVMRIRELPGAIVPVHSHPVDEHITVVQGTWYFALGDEYRFEALQPLDAGGYAFAPKGRSMFAYSPAGAIVQVHGVGPFRIHWHDGLHTLDDADAKSLFRFERGQRVAFKGRHGTIAEGYASGAIVQYEIETASGERSMVSERDLEAE